VACSLGDLGPHAGNMCRLHVWRGDQGRGMSWCALYMVEMAPGRHAMQLLRLVHG
jgi:hypothetical protein